MVKIIRIITRLNIGGPAIHAILLNGELNKCGYKDILVAGTVSESEGDMMYLAADKNVRPYIISELGRKISFKKDILAIFSLYRIIKKEMPDIVHTHTAKAGTLGRLAAILAGVPVKVHTFHGHIFDGYFSPLRARVFILIEKLLAFFTDRVIVVSQQVKDDIVKKLNVTSSAKSVVIPLGLELDDFLRSDRHKGSLRKSLNIPNDFMLVGIVGRLVPIKNHKMFLDAAAIIRNNFPMMKIKFLIIGDGEMRGTLMKYASEKGLDDSVIFTGWLTDLVSAYADLDVVTLTSLNEGTPVSLIEAMASGRPVVATDVGGVRDLLTDGYNGLLIKSGDSRTLSERISALLSDPENGARIGASGRKHVAERYTKERLIRDITLLYNDLLAYKGLRR